MEVIAWGRPHLDLASGQGLPDLIDAAKPEAIVNAAAYTAVDRAEAEESLATAINAHGAARLAAIARRLDIPFIHLSTDYVFDGRPGRPKCESDPTAPLGAYGRSKLAGERAVFEANPRAIILRTAWVYGPCGDNFVLTMLRLAAERERLQVVDDQVGNPTSALDIADGIATVLVRLRDLPQTARGLYHMTGGGEASRWEFAAEVVRLSALRGSRKIPVEPISTSAYPTQAARPADSRLDCSKFLDVFGACLPDWRISLADVIDILERRRREAACRAMVSPS
jgi:dTDP-4-dehydrorhamnose reductase